MIVVIVNLTFYREKLNFAIDKIKKKLVKN